LLSQAGASTVVVPALCVFSSDIIAPHRALAARAARKMASNGAAEAAPFQSGFLKMFYSKCLFKFCFGHRMTYVTRVLKIGAVHGFAFESGGHGRVHH